MHAIVPIDTPTLGDRSYLVHNGRTAFVIDPQRDIDRVLEHAARAGVAITDVFETHIHSDYVTGGHAPAAACGAAYHVGADDPVGLDRRPVRDDDLIAVGDDLVLRAMATPGHTHTHLAYVLEEAGRPVAVFTGGSLLFGATGRPDLLGPEHTGSLARAQYRSAHRLAAELPPDTEVLPTHGFGSFCAATQADADRSTIGREMRANPVLTATEADYVTTLLAGLDAWPAYYAHMAPANLAGPGPADLATPRAADPAELRARIDGGQWVVDLRSRIAFAAGHVPGTLAFGLDGSLATYLGWLIPWGTPLTLLGEPPEQVARAQRELARIGIDRLEASATGTPADWSGNAPLATMRTATLADLRHALDLDTGPVVLDVRRDSEWADGHLPDAVHIPLHELADRIAEIPDGRVWVHCHGGYRAAIAASLLAAAGRDVVAVDDDFDGATAAGLALTGAPGRTATTGDGSGPRLDRPA